MEPELKGAAGARRQVLRSGISTPYKAMSVPEAAAVAGVATSTLYDMIGKNDGPKLTRIGQRSVVLLCDFEAWMQGLRDKAA